MFSFKRIVATVVIVVQCTDFSPASETFSHDEKTPVVQLAILLDTSNSMDGLIEQAKSQLWKIANELAYAKREGKPPILQVALYEYGNNALSAAGYWIRQVTPFTTNLDQVSQALFSLNTNGGEEYCGAVIREAVKNLAWDPRSDVYKVIFIAGNEPFTQGPIPFQEAIAEAQAHGITVNTIFCGNYAEGVQTAWDAGARAGHGRFFNIDQDQKIIVVPTPYDRELGQLGILLNDTIVTYGVRGRMALQEAKQADALAVSAPESAAAPLERSVYKATPQYFSAAGDIAGAVASGQLQTRSLKKEDLPAALQRKSPAELETYLKDQNARRQVIQKKIIGLKEKRETFIAEHKAPAQGATQTLDAAIQSAVREQGAVKGLKFAR